MKPFVDALRERLAGGGPPAPVADEADSPAGLSPWQPPVGEIDPAAPLPPGALEADRPAAVLVPLYRDAGRWHLLFIKRTHTVPEHPGQVAFPGGRADPEDRDRLDTALRETEEEIGLKRRDVEVLGTLPARSTSTGYDVTPVVGVFPWPYELVLSAHELSLTFGVPLAWLADPAHLEVRTWNHPRRGPNTRVHVFRYGEHVIWGATAHILKDFLELARPILPPTVRPQRCNSGPPPAGRP